MLGVQRVSGEHAPSNTVFAEPLEQEQRRLNLAGLGVDLGLGDDGAGGMVAGGDELDGVRVTDMAVLRVFPSMAIAPLSRQKPWLRNQVVVISSRCSAETNERMRRTVGSLGGRTRWYGRRSTRQPQARRMSLGTCSI